MKAFIPSTDAQRLVVLADVPEPKTAPDEAVVEVAAFSVNRGETFLLERPSQDWRPGKDIAGTVLRAAADGSGPAVAERVVAHPSSAGWAERVAVKTAQIATLPDTVSEVVAAALPLAGLTALRLLRVTGPLASRRVLMTGASGGVGHFFTELAAMGGAEVTVVTGSPERGARLRELGAAHVVHDVADAEAPFDVVLESVGGTSLQAGLVKLRPRGALIWFGQASRVAPSIDFFRFWEGPASGTIRHFHYTDSDVLDGRDLQTLVQFVASGRLHPEIGLVSDWENTDQVLRTLRDRGVRGNAVLTRTVR
ncbi:zinc-binding dehydrogenase [Bradyrhizobium septentrionale]|uniref:Zinc-binding dehydrogenase n=1 Tax=Bradyrhizobium septentrionale TaxID=1404411 RepID=A0A973VU34_9BRAD|nr:zinc-binding dehydrogenase [Bradyrhizobium septentrionale]UGY18977.1 zinc-binding dehydrogenase [Bradyrhizobium septentrionale]UGY27705.1 zinc-binding dehydrogenase [Bradyrhizobium septentrionale]